MIEAVGQELSADDSLVVDVLGQIVLPGLIDSTLPGMHVAMDETGQHDLARYVDHQRVVGRELLSDRLDHIPPDQYIADEVAMRGIHRQHVPTTQQHLIQATRWLPNEPVENGIIRPIVHRHHRTLW